MKNYTKPELKQKSKKNQKILLIIPAYNEEENILKTYKTIVNYNKQNKTNYDVIVINDGSTDKTSEICFNNHIPTVNLIHNLGIGGAVQTGYKYAYENAYDIAIQYDGDGQHDVRYVKKIVEPILNGKADFVIGSRFVKKSDENFNSTFARRIGINIISFFIKLVSKKKIYDTTSGFRACNKAIIHEFAFEYPLEYPEPITTVELIKKGYRVSEVDVKMNERKGGTSSIKSWKNIYYMINVVLSILIIGSRRQK
ncbi:MAG: glycosyltransferase family 2 protein [Bacilli bacterium]